jgi:hypothetical protein
MFTNPQAPSVVRSVHYVSYGTPGGEYSSVCRAAIITEVSDELAEDAIYPCVGLCVLNPTGMFFNQHVHYDEGKPIEGPLSRRPDGRYLPDLSYKPGTWHWPERVD